MPERGASVRTKIVRIQRVIISLPGGGVMIYVRVTELLQRLRRDTVFVQPQ